MTRPARNRRLSWALGVSLALHVLAAAGVLAWLWLMQPRLKPPPDRQATVDVVMGDSAETSGANAPPPDPPTVQIPRDALPSPTPSPPTDPLPPGETPAPPPVPASPPPPPDPPAPPTWQAASLLGDGMVGAAKIIGDQLRPAVGEQGNIPPGYPLLSTELGEQGLVLLRMHISAEGLVEAVEVLQTSGYPRLDRAARSAIAKWRFTPAVENGQPVELSQDLPVRFELN